MSNQKLYQQLVAEGIVAVRTESCRTLELLKPELDADVLVLRVPTHWDIQAATWPESPGLPNMTIRPAGLPWLTLRFTDDGGEWLTVTHNQGLSYFARLPLPAGITQSAVCAPRAQLEIPVNGISAGELVVWYRRLRQAVIRYCYLPGVPAEYGEPQYWELVTHAQELAHV
ncbi:MAG: hypothetical protein CVV27_04710 [Candidatus Melainabacteria bacterium HGW-Melainabacteria-1]|nr:MAG: hypothetical protein CVV27_04710 [Candidatus Melainabacteria bacterium HGW-Melainabacteria-1]